MDIVALIKDHWEAIAIVLGALGGIWNLLKQKAWQELFKLCVELVRKVAVTELEAAGPEKRKIVVDQAWDAAPAWAKALIKKEQLELIAEQAYQLLKGELKAEAAEGK